MRPDLSYTHGIPPNTGTTQSNIYSVPTMENYPQSTRYYRENIEYDHNSLPFIPEMHHPGYYSALHPYYVNKPATLPPGYSYPVYPPRELAENPIEFHQQPIVSLEYPHSSIYPPGQHYSRMISPRFQEIHAPSYLPPRSAYKSKVSHLPLTIPESKTHKAGLWCHQCKKRSRNVVYCSTYDLGFCSKKYCKRCLEKHYNENFDAIDQKNWLCMFCRGICLCASCRRKRGEIVPKRVMKNKRKASAISNSSNDENNSLEETHERKKLKLEDDNNSSNNNESNITPTDEKST